MKKTLLATLIIGFSSHAFAADHAILNVEGEIQINGKTVIDENGKVAAAALPASAGGSINLSDYEQAVGVYEYDYSYYDDYNYSNVYCQVKESITLIDVISEESCTSEYFDRDRQKNVIKTYIDKWIANKTSIGENFDWSYSVSIKDKETNDELYAWSDSGFEDLQITTLNDLSNTYQLGTATSSLAKVKVIDSSYTDEIGEEFFSYDVYNFSTEILNITINGKTFESCLIPVDNYYIGLEFVCKGAGWLSASPENVSMSASSTSNAQTAVATRENYRVIKQLRDQKIKQRRM